MRRRDSGFSGVQGYLIHSGTRDDRKRVVALKIGKAVLDSAACRPSVYAAAEHELSSVVIQEITADSVTVMRQEKDHAVTETIPIADIAKIKRPVRRR